jgi:hypothetical protein
MLALHYIYPAYSQFICVRDKDSGSVSPPFLHDPSEFARLELMFFPPELT